MAPEVVSEVLPDQRRQMRTEAEMAPPVWVTLSAGPRKRQRRQYGRRDGITRLRGRWCELTVPGLDAPVPTLPMFHPAFLLRSPERKREAWRDLLALRARFDAAAEGGEG